MHFCTVADFSGPGRWNCTKVIKGQIWLKNFVKIPKVNDVLLNLQSLKRKKKFPMTLYAHTGKKTHTCLASWYFSTKVMSSKKSTMCILHEKYEWCLLFHKDANMCLEFWIVTRVNRWYLSIATAVENMLLARCSQIWSIGNFASGKFRKFKDGRGSHLSKTGWYTHNLDQEILV